MKLLAKRGRKKRDVPTERQVIDIVFAVRYRGAKAHTWFPSEEGELARKPGTVDGFRRKGPELVAEHADCGIEEACAVAERAFELKTEKRRGSWDVSVHPETGERSENVRPPLIGRRKSEAVMDPGTATRQWLYRAMRAELKQLKVWGDWSRAHRAVWARDADAKRRKKARRRI